MRFLSTLFSFLIFIAILAVGVFFLSRELLLWWGVNSFKSSIRAVDREANNASYAAECMQRNPDSGVPDVTVQLRFTSGTEYVIEAVCSQFSRDPVLISKNHLPPFITKVPGSSGIVWGMARSAVELQVFDELVTEVQKTIKMNVAFLEKSRVVGVENNALVVLAADEDLGYGPVTSCEGYGFQCCRAETHIGVGERITGLDECSDSCYSSCSSRPVVLSFGTIPLFDPKTRQVTVPSGAAIDFSYVADSPGANFIQAKIDFGDGTNPGKLEGSSNKTTHVYTCPSGSCTYVARLTLQDSWRVESFDSPISALNIVVQAQ